MIRPVEGLGAAEMITSYIKIVPNPTPTDLGLPQQVELFGWIERETGVAPAVVDSADVLRDPGRVLGGLCARLGVAWCEEMLRWEAGARDTDGVWGPWWYDAVYRSTGFGPARSKGEEVPARLRGVLEECEGLYKVMAGRRIR